MTVVHLKGVREAPKSMRSQMDTILGTTAEVDKWLIPPFQRPLKVNQKVLDLADELTKNGGVIPGVLTLGRIEKNQTTYVVDGQHRIQAFRISNLKEFIADVRIVMFESLADMAEEFVNLQQSLVKMNPDDVLRGLEESVKSLGTMREKCPFVGYGQVRRNADHAPILSMSAVLRCWAGSASDAPVSSASGRSSAQLARELCGDDLNNLIALLDMCYRAWSRDPQNFRLWAGLNLTMTMWMFRRFVLDKERYGARRHVVMTTDQFKKCLTALSADGDYVDWLRGRNMNDRDRAPCYSRVKAIFAARMAEEAGGKKPAFLQPAWSSK